MSNHLSLSLPEYAQLVNNISLEEILTRSKYRFIDKTEQKIKIVESEVSQLPCQFIVPGDELENFIQWLDFVGGNRFFMRDIFQDKFVQVKIANESYRFQPNDSNLHNWRFSFNIEFLEAEFSDF